MIILTFLLFCATVVAENSIHIQYFRRPEEYGIFKVIIDGSRQWESYIYMNRSANLREEEIYKLVKPFFEQDPSTRRYESSSITRHLGKQFEYILNRYTIDEIAFENLCSQMKPKFSSIILSTTQTPKKIKWVVEHPSAPFTIPTGFTKNMGRDEYQIEIGGKAKLDDDNFDFEALQNTQKLIIKQPTEFKNGVNGKRLLKFFAPELYMEGTNEIDSDSLKEFGKEWLEGDRIVRNWEIHLYDEKQSENLYFEKNGTTLQLTIENGRFTASTYKTPEGLIYTFTSL
ncbi:GLPGLI family protein [Caenorhabditis elegans]|uniref:GLPGLI family protein n=1 Tax=Caenorhabditis elegans TaxID=6239 RepID=G5EBP0_CAEEL|nr:GLPGLI family protein [Caenorhabditis elegans]CAA94295.2 GLPGLI family protein [Caenorhabditis elegans]|eukprot:NP_501973.2 Uncharacterized protein CELE_K08C7.6 [Caenorhabditis elegans]